MRCLFLVVLLGLGVSAQADPPKPGKDYVRLANTATVPSGKIEVRQFFSYRCWACYQQSVQLQPLIRSLPEDVVFARTALPSKGSEQNANNELKVYYALEQMKVTDLIHLSLLKDSGVRGDEALRSKSFTSLMVANGVSTNRFNTAYASPAVMKKIGEGKQLAQHLGIQNVPAIVVNGKYLVTGRSENTHRIIQYLVAVERKAQQKDQPKP